MKPILFNTESVKAILDGRKSVTRRVVKPQPTIYGFLETHWNWSGVKSPYQLGDTLYVRETWATWVEMRKSGQTGHLEQFYYKADSDFSDVKWRPSIHMPKEAARLFLRVTNVRVERLQRITLADAYAEGVEIPTRFYELWDSTIKKADLPLYGWKANPWVWVIVFERISKEEVLRLDKRINKRPVLCNPKRQRRYAT